MGKGTGKRGPDPKEPTPEQRARFLELKERAHRIWLLGQENEFFRVAALTARWAQALVHEAMGMREQRGVGPERPAKEVIDELAALQRWERQVLAFRRKHLDPRDAKGAPWLDAWDAQINAYPEPVNERVRAALCLLRFVDDMLRSEVATAGVSEEVSLPGETEEQILDRLIKAELGLSGFAAARLAGRRADFEDAARRSAERRGDAVRRVFDRLEKHLRAGLIAGGAKLGPEHQREVDQLVRQTAVLASANPVLDVFLPRVNAREKPGRKSSSSGPKGPSSGAQGS